jgi:signal transduction histidine kinase
MATPNPPQPSPAVDATHGLDAAADLALPGMVHDLNNVFQNLIEAADLLAGDPRWVPVSEAILRSIERGRDIAMSLHAIGQPSAPFQTVLGNAEAFVADSVVLSRGPRIQFRSIVEPGLMLRQPWAWERVLINLFLNAVRAMPQGGTISSEAGRVNGEVRIVIADEGCGIPADLLPRIFDPKVSTKPLGGLGLHIVRSIVQQQDGEVAAANREGTGAVFTITIPARRPAARGASAS